MNVDEAMEAAAGFRADAWTLFSETVAVLLASEIERLRAELAAAKAEIESVIRLGPHPVEQVQMPLATFVETRFVPVWQYNELADKLERTRAELAAAKAASVVPVKWKSEEQFFQSGADRGNQWGIELWFENKEQREQFHKWLKERGEE